MPKKIKEGVGSESSETNKPEEQVAPKLSKDELDLAKEEAKKEAKLELEKEEEAKRLAKRDELDAEIRVIQANKHITPEQNQVLNKLMQERAKMNKELPRDLDKPLPSQFTLEEMLKTCDDNIKKAEKSKDEAAIEKAEVLRYKKGDSTVMLRARIKAFRDPAQVERLRMLENRRVEGVTVR